MASTTYNSSSTWTAQATNPTVDCHGAGGGGGSNYFSDGTGGGGGGAYSYKAITGLTLGTSYTVTIGAGGCSHYASCEL